MITRQVPCPDVNVDAPFQMQISALDYNSYVGVIGIGRITRGHLSPNQPVVVVDGKGGTRRGETLTNYGTPRPEKSARRESRRRRHHLHYRIDGLRISDTLCAPENVEALPALSVDEPTVGMTFQVNDSPFAGRDGKYITSRNLKERLEEELIHNVALCVEQGDSPDKFQVSGRGELHLSVLIETMRREGFEMGVSRPEVIQKEINGETQEPYEAVVFDIKEEHQGVIMEELGLRKSTINGMTPDGKGRIKLEYTVPSRGLIGFRGLFLTLTSGTGIMTSIFDHYGAIKTGESPIVKTAC